MLSLKNGRLFSGGMASIHAPIRPRTEALKPNAQFLADQVSHEVFKIGRGEIGEIVAHIACCY